MATTSGKDTIYIDIDDEITTIIEKVRASPEKIVALVLPKRASVLQSIVNMKLLQRTADQEKKRIVLITAEAGLLPLAGSVGLYVAKSLQTKPEIPNFSGAPDDEEEIIAEAPDEADEVTAATAGNRPVGELATASASATAAPLVADEAIETLQLDDEPADAAFAPDASAGNPTESKKAQKTKKPKKDKKLGVPNFERFRLFLLLSGLLLIVLLVGGVYAATVLPKASVIISTDTSSINSNLALTVDTTAKTLDTSKLIIPAQVQKVNKTGSQQVPTTGKLNNGQKASGQVTLVDCSNNDETIPAGTGFSSGGTTFISQSTITVPASSFRHGNCEKDLNASVQVVAQTAGSSANLPANSSFTVAGGFTGLSGQGSTAGGTDNNVQIVAQADIDNATQKITAQNSSAVQSQLEQQLQQAGLYPLPATFVAGTPSTSNSAQVGDQVSTVTVTQTTTYTMFGVKQADLKTLVDADIKDKIDPSKQTILDEGLDKATFKVNAASATSAQVALSTTATAGPDLKADDVKQQIAGKKAGQVEDMLKSDPGISDVAVHLSPFWVTSVPHKASKVTVTFQKAQ